MKLGHTLIVPKQEVGYVLDLDDEVYEHIMRIAKKRIWPAVQSATWCDRIGLLVEWYGIQDHFHLHVVPIDKAGELDFDKAHKESEEDMKEVHLKILNQM